MAWLEWEPSVTGARAGDGKKLLEGEMFLGETSGQGWLGAEGI